MTTTQEEGEHAILLVCRKEREYILLRLTVSSLPTPQPPSHQSSKWTFFRKKMQKIYTSCCKLICDISVDEATDQTWTQPFFLHDCKERKSLLPFKKYLKNLPGRSLTLIRWQSSQNYQHSEPTTTWSLPCPRQSTATISPKWSSNNVVSWLSSSTSS
jgi:hypothetical protein